MSDNVSHQDKTRSKVGITAHLVASGRAAENAKEDGLFKDPYAHLLGVTPEMEASLPVVDSYRAEGRTAENDRASYDACAVRTRKIDDEFARFLKETPKAQIVALGAGLDTRAFRLNIIPRPGVTTSSTSYFELDFPEIFDFKLPVLAQAGAVATFDYHSVAADLSLPGWIEKLTAAGFDASVPTFWLLEGFTGYLTETEFHSLFDTLTELSAPCSRVVATFLTPATETFVNLHRFRPAVPIDEVTRHAGWAGAQEDIRAVALTYNRPIGGTRHNGYFFVIADYNK